jgi:two-component system, OmpR family, sensor histidine kinase ChvG
VRIALAEADFGAHLTVSNKGPRLPEAMRTRLFESMISVRAARDPATPHLGLGLYVARLIVEFHGGSIGAADLPAGDGVALSVRLPLSWK